MELYTKVQDKITGTIGTIVDYAKENDPTSGYLIEPDNVAALDDNDPLSPYFGRYEDELIPLE